MNLRKSCLIFLLSIGFAGQALPLWAKSLNVAVASNFATTLASIGEKFKDKYDIEVNLSRGSTGKLTAQISNGAPFDIFLAANSEHLNILSESGLLLEETRFTYAIGQLVLWSGQADLVDESGEVLKNASNFKHLAISNPSTAPYGIAAKQVLQNLGVWQGLEEKLVIGESIAQTFQFVESGNAELGFIALAQLKNTSSLNKVGSMWLVPQTLYLVLEQQAVILKRTKNLAESHLLMEFLRSEEIREFILQQGYLIK